MIIRRSFLHTSLGGLRAEAKGPTFYTIKPDSDGKADFIATKDVWFRPANLVNAPDGCLHAADFYREAIEHPWSLPESFHARMDLERGRDKGRIYRIEPKEYKHRAAPKLSNVPSTELVAVLEHKNAWHRETAHRLLFERQDKSVVPALTTMATENNEPLGRLHALWTLQGLITNIIDPNREVAPGYMEYIAKTKSGEVLTGRVVAESASGITLKMADNSTRDIPRKEIASLINSGRSLMPDGLEAAISPQAMADLVSFLHAAQ